MAWYGCSDMSHLRHVDSLSLCAGQLNREARRSFTLKSHPGKKALARFVTEASIEVAALSTAGSGTQAIAFIAADHAEEKLLPFHVLGVAPCQQGKVPLHQAGQLAPIHKT